MSTHLVARWFSNFSFCSDCQVFMKTDLGEKQKHHQRANLKNLKVYIYIYAKCIFEVYCIYLSKCQRWTVQHTVTFTKVRCGEWCHDYFSCICIFTYEDICKIIASKWKKMLKCFNKGVFLMYSTFKGSYTP